MHPAPQHSFLPCLFSCERKDRAAGGTSEVTSTERAAGGISACGNMKSRCISIEIQRLLFYRSYAEPGGEDPVGDGGDGADQRGVASKVGMQDGKLLIGGIERGA